MHKHTMDAVLDHILELILDNEIDKAIVAIVRTKQALKVESMYDDVARPHPDDRESLPNLRPFKPKRPKSINVSCPTCGAKAGKPCFEMINAGRNATPTDVVRAKGYHAKRTAKAKEAS